MPESKPESRPERRLSPLTEPRVTVDGIVGPATWSVIGAHGEELAAGQAARLGGAGAGREGGVEHVDVDAHVDRAVADAGRDPLDHAEAAEVLKLSRRHQLESDRAVRD